METMVKPPRTGKEAFEMLPEGTLCQLINDRIIISPATTPNHQTIIEELFFQIRNFVKKNHLGKVFFSPIDVYLNDTNIFQPDIVFISTANLNIIDWNKGIMGTPELVIEILSRGSRTFDLKTKKIIYEQNGVREYWVVDPETKWCEGFVLREGKYLSIGEFTGNLVIRTFDLELDF